MRSPMTAVVRLGALTLVLSAGLDGPKAEAATLRWKFTRGETLHYAVDLKTEATMKPPNTKALTSTLTQKVELTWEVKKVADDGIAEMTQTIDRVYQKMESPLTGTFEFDTKDRKEPVGPAAETAPLYKALVGTPVPFKINAKGEVSEVKVPEKLTKMFQEAGPNAAIASGVISEPGLKKMIEQTTLELPKEDLAKGKAWTKQDKVNSPIGPMTSSTTYTDDGPARDGNGMLESISMVTKVNFEAPLGADAPIEIKSQSTTGVFLFDNAAGRLADSRITDTLEMVAKVMKLEIPQTNVTTITRKLVMGEPK
jgi:hypothetical protein